MFNNNFMGAGSGGGSYPMLNPPAFISPYRAAPPLGMAMGGYLPQQPSPVAPQPPVGGGQKTLGMAAGGYLPEQPQQDAQQPINPELLSAFQAYMAQQQQQQQPNNMPLSRPTFPARAAPAQMGLGSLMPTSRMPQMPSMSGYGYPKAGI